MERIAAPLRPCPRCEPAEFFTPQIISERLKETPISPALAADEQVIAKRLMECEKCGALREQVLCAHCGCFVMFRARPRKSYCPHPLGDKWKSSSIVNESNNNIFKEYQL